MSRVLRATLLQIIKKYKIHPWKNLCINLTLCNVIYIGLLRIHAPIILAPCAGIDIKQRHCAEK